MQDRKEANEQLDKWWQRQWDDIVDDFEHPDHIPEKFEEEFVDIENELVKDEEAVADVVTHGFDLTKAWNIMLGARWVLNCIFVAAPTAFFLLTVNISDVLFMTLYNKLWGHGNVFWIVNWLYLVSQTLLSIPVLFEIQQVMYWIRPLRILALASGITYNVLWLGALFDFLYIFFFTDEKEFDDPQGLGDIFIQLFLAYNLVLAAPNVLVNLV